MEGEPKRHVLKFEKEPTPEGKNEGVTHMTTTMQKSGCATLLKELLEAVAMEAPTSVIDNIGDWITNTLLSEPGLDFGDAVIVDFIQNLVAYGQNEGLALLLEILDDSEWPDEDLAESLAGDLADIMLDWQAKLGPNSDQEVKTKIAKTLSRVYGSAIDRIVLAGNLDDSVKIVILKNMFKEIL